MLVQLREGLSVNSDYVASVELYSSERDSELIVKMADGREHRISHRDNYGNRKPTIFDAEKALKAAINGR